MKYVTMWEETLAETLARPMFAYMEKQLRQASHTILRYITHFTEILRMSTNLDLRSLNSDEFG